MARPKLENILGRHAKHDLTDRLVVQYAPLALLRDRVDVAQTAFERIFLEYRHRAAMVKQRIDDLPRRLNRPGGGKPQAGPLIQGHLAAFLDRFERFVGRSVKEVTRGPPLRLGLRHVRLDDVVLHHRLARATANLFPRQAQERVHRATSNTKGYSTESDRIELGTGETVKWAVAPAVARIIAIDGALARNEQIVDGILVAGRATQSQRVPDIVEGGARFGIQQGLRFPGARHPHMRAKPGGVLTAAHEAPFSGE